MATLNAQQSVNTRDLPELAEIGNGDDYSSTSNGNNPGIPGGIEYFGSGSPNYLGLHIKLNSVVGDLVLGGGQPFSMTINEIEVFASSVPVPNDPKFDIRGISIQMTDLWADAGDNGKLDTIPAEIFKGNDTLNGSPFADVLFGFDGDDKITGGGGRDEMNGGDGRDTFFFLSTLDSTKQASGRDTIFKFDRSEDDEIDLTAIDAKVGGIDNEFKFIGKKDFHDKKGELRYSDKHGDILIQGDTNGDGKADFAILLDGVSKLKVSDFEL